MSREQYRKHRAKRLAEAAEKYWANPEAGRERSRAMYAKHKEKRAEYAREYRRRKREEVNAKALEKYWANRDAIIERRKGYDIDIEARRAYHNERRKGDPEEALRHDAKKLLYEQTGLRIRDMPDDLVQAKVEQLRITRWVKKQVAAVGAAETPNSIPTNTPHP
jgi:hypothetical protein